MNNVDISYTFIAKAMLRDSLLCVAPPRSTATIVRRTRLLPPAAPASREPHSAPVPDSS